MKSLSTAFESLLNNPQGLRGVYVLAIEWSDTVTQYYSTEPIDNIDGVDVNPSLTSIGPYTLSKYTDTVINYSNIPVEMCQKYYGIDYYIRFHGIIGKKATVYLHFINDTTYDLTDLLVILQGTITTPFVQDDLIRTVSFNITGVTKGTKIKQLNDTDLEANTYPVSFGTVQNVPAILQRLNEVVDYPTGKATTTVDFAVYCKDSGGGFANRFNLGIASEGDNVNPPSPDCYNGYIWDGSEFYYDSARASTDPYANLPQTEDGELLIRCDPADTDLDDILDNDIQYSIIIDMDEGQNGYCRMLLRETMYCEFFAAYKTDATRAADTNITKRRLILYGTFISINKSSDPTNLNATVTDRYLKVTNVNPQIAVNASLTTRQDDANPDGTKAYFDNESYDYTAELNQLEGRILVLYQSLITYNTSPNFVGKPNHANMVKWFVTDFDMSGSNTDKIFTVYPIKTTTTVVSSVQYYTLMKAWFSLADVQTAFLSAYTAAGTAATTYTAGSQACLKTDSVTTFLNDCKRYSVLGRYFETGHADGLKSKFLGYYNTEALKKWSSIYRYIQPSPANYPATAWAIVQETLKDPSGLPDATLGIDDLTSPNCEPAVSLKLLGYHYNVSYNYLTQSVTINGTVYQPITTTLSEDSSKVDIVVPASTDIAATLADYLDNRQEGADEFFSYILKPGTKIQYHCNFSVTNGAMNKVLLSSQHEFKISTSTSGEVTGTAEYVYNLASSSDVTVKCRNTATDTLDTIPNDDEENYTVYDDYEQAAGLDGTVSVVKFKKSLQSISSDYSDEVYVSYTSALPNNPIDIIRYLIDGYVWDTDEYVSSDFQGFLNTYTCDEDSFIDAREALEVESLEMNFAILDTKEVIDVISQVAMYALCVVLFGDEKVKIRYIGQLADELPGKYYIYQVGTLKKSLIDIVDRVTRIEYSYVSEYDKNELKLIREIIVPDPKEDTRSVEVFSGTGAYDYLKRVSKRLFDRESKNWYFYNFDTYYVLACILELYDVFDLGDGKYGELVEMSFNMMDYTATVKIMLNSTLEIDLDDSRWELYDDEDDVL